MRSRLILVPSNLGHEGEGVGAGPDHLVETGAVGALTAAGHEVETVRVTAPEGATNEVGASFAVVRDLAGAVAEAVSAGAFPIVLAGNCLTSVGTVAGLGRDVAVVWLDAHADFNTPDSTPSGFLDGMGLSVLVGEGWRALRETVPGYQALPEANVALVGIRDVDGAEQERLAASQIAVVPPAEAGDGLGQALDRLASRVAEVYLHLDLDVLDPSEGRANPWAVPGGLSVVEAERVVAAVGERFAVRAAALTAYDPAADAEGKIPPLAARLLERLAATAEPSEAAA
jgi:arginase